MGCGAGTLAIAAALALETEILATDIDPDAVSVTNRNAIINKAEQFIHANCVNGFDDPVFADRKFDLIFANILAGPLVGLAPEISEHLEEHGQVILSGILDEQADKVAAAFSDQNLDIKKGPSLSGWTSLLGKKRSA